MLSELSIRNVVLIESLDLDFQHGLTALTGETGAGKSIILDALTMASGARSDKGLVRKNCDKAQCIASFDLPSHHIVWKILHEAEFECSQTHTLILRRVINADGRSKAYLNDVPVSVKLLSIIGSHLLEIHGQHDGRGLLDPTQHISMLDGFGQYDQELLATRQAFSDMQARNKAYESLKAKAQQGDSDREFFAFAIEELDQLDVRAGEEIELANRRRFLQGAEGALSELANAGTILGNHDYEARLAAALAGIERVRDKIGTVEGLASDVLEQAAHSVDKALLETQEARQAVANAADAFHISPHELDETEQRLFAIKAACRKYGVNADELALKRQEFSKGLSLIENIDSELETAERALETARLEYDKCAKALSKARQLAAQDLEKGVHEELPALKMEKANFKVHMETSIDTALGREKIRFLVSTNPGTPMAPMDKVASGGELARFSLAIKVALANSQDQLLIFDEVDQGVGGAVASAVGQRLSRLAQNNSQVLIVTHSPQVAAWANHQYRIEKASLGDMTTTSVVPVAESEREEEIARMLAGEIITDEARAAARQLMLRF